ncbi:MAG: hypothetical protein H6739_15100 [Alphaproteobacteria bacterium]|nr:hypothetical protein [Alphaproteobacteria bacterium]
MPLLLLLLACSRGDTRGSLPCDEDLVDVYIVQASSDLLTVGVDTVSVDDTFDPAVTVFAHDGGRKLEDLVLGRFLDDGDDEFPCSFPPPEYACPQVSFDAPGDVVVLVQVYGECVGPDAGYLLMIDQDGIPPRVKHLGTAAVDRFDQPREDDSDTDTGDLEG